MRIVTIILGILTIMLGGFCAFKPGITVLSMAWMFGILLLLCGVMIVINYFANKIGSGWDLLFGILAILGGLTLLFNQYSDFLAEAILINVWGLFTVVMGVLRIIASFKIKKEKAGSWGWVLAFGILAVVLGFFVIGHPLIAMISVGYMIAFSIICQGINIIYLAVVMK